MDAVLLGKIKCRSCSPVFDISDVYKGRGKPSLSETSHGLVSYFKMYVNSSFGLSDCELIHGAWLAADKERQSLVRRDYQMPISYTHIFTRKFVDASSPASV